VAREAATVLGFWHCSRIRRECQTSDHLVEAAAWEKAFPEGIVAFTGPFQDEPLQLEHQRGPFEDPHLKVLRLVCIGPQD
jgi:hypothetical protein